MAKSIMLIGTHDAETGSETIEENGVVKCVNAALRSREREEEWRAHYQLHAVRFSHLDNIFQMASG